MNATRRKYTTGQVADRFGVTERTIRDWADNGKLTCTRTLGGARRFDADRIDQMAAES
jgi:excisionase family DNA binding protein